MFRSSLSFIYTTDIFGTVCKGLLSMEGTLKISLEFTYMFTSHTLDKYFSVLVDEYVWLSLLGVDSSLHSVEQALRAAYTPR